MLSSRLSFEKRQQIWNFWNKHQKSSISASSVLNVRFLEFHSLFKLIPKVPSTLADLLHLVQICLVSKFNQQRRTSANYSLFIVLFRSNCWGRKFGLSVSIWTHVFLSGVCCFFILWKYLISLKFNCKGSN